MHSGRSRTRSCRRSADYPTRFACQHEFATAYLAGHAEGDPLRRVIAINLERTLDHIEPKHLRDALLPTVPTNPPALSAVADAVTERVATIETVIGEVADRPPRWRDSRPVHPPSPFVGRWRELWWLHSALHPHVGRLTSPPTPPIAVVHGLGGISKTALAAEYVRRFGSAFLGGILWRSAGNSAASTTTRQAPRRSLWIVDDAQGRAEDIASWLPPDPETPCLVLTRDPRLAKLGTALGLADLTTAESGQLAAAHGLAGAHALPERVEQRQGQQVHVVLGGAEQLVTGHRVHDHVGVAELLDRHLHRAGRGQPDRRPVLEVGVRGLVGHHGRTTLGKAARGRE